MEDEELVSQKEFGVPKFWKTNVFSEVVESDLHEGREVSRGSAFEREGAVAYICDIEAVRSPND